jgi:hypothetical protein
VIVERRLPRASLSKDAKSTRVVLLAVLEEALVKAVYMGTTFSNYSTCAQAYTFANVPRVTLPQML